MIDVDATTTGTAWANLETNKALVLIASSGYDFNTMQHESLSNVLSLR